MRKLKGDKNNWDKYEGYSLESSSNKWKYNKADFDLFNSNREEEEKEVTKDNRKKEGICKSLGNNEREVLLKNKKHTFKPV